MSPMTLEQFHSRYATNPHRENLVNLLQQELEYWKAISSSFRAWAWGPFLGVADQPDAINVLLIAILKPPDPNSPKRQLKPQIQVHFRLANELVTAEQMVKTFNNLPQNIENNIRLDASKVVEISL
jgi:hypothetical protein